MFKKKKRRISVEKLSELAKDNPIATVVKAEHPKWDSKKKEVKEETNTFSNKNKKILDLKMEEPIDNSSKSFYAEPADDDIIYGVDKNIKLKKGRSANINVEGALNSKDKSISADYINKKGAEISSNYNKKEGAGIRYSSPNKRSINVNLGKKDKSISAGYSSPSGASISGRYVPNQLIGANYNLKGGSNVSLEYDKDYGLSAGYMSKKGQNIRGNYKPKENIDINYSNQKNNQYGISYNPSEKSVGVRARINLNKNKK